MATEQTAESLRQFTRDLPVTLNDHELQVYGKMLAEKCKEQELALERKKQVMADHAARIKTITNEIKRIADARAKGEELRPVKCSERLRGNVIEIVRLDREEVVDTRPADLRDLQTSIPGTGIAEIPEGFDEGPRGDDLGTPTPYAGPSLVPPPTEEDLGGPDKTGRAVTTSVGDTVWTHEPEETPALAPPAEDVVTCTHCGEVITDDDEIEVLGKNGPIAHKSCHEESLVPSDATALVDDEGEEAPAALPPFDTSDATADDDEIDRRLKEREASLAETSKPKPTRERSAKANASKPKNGNGKKKR